MFVCRAAPAFFAWDSEDGVRGEVDALLPEGWSVVAIDLEAGCVQLSLDNEVQEPVCML